MEAESGSNIEKVRNRLMLKSCSNIMYIWKYNIIDMHVHIHVWKIIDMHDCEV